MSEELDNKKLESVKRGLTLIGETTSLETIDNLERMKLSTHLLTRASIDIARSYGIKIARSTGELMNESELRMVKKNE